jgi:hypothetical protein
VPVFSADAPFAADVLFFETAVFFEDAFRFDFGASRGGCRDSGAELEACAGRAGCPRRPWRAV